MVRHRRDLSRDRLVGLRAHLLSVALLASCLVATRVTAQNSCVPDPDVPFEQTADGLV